MSGTKTSKIIKGLAIAAGVGVVAGAAYEIFCPRAQFFGKVITHGSRKNMAVGIVFDQSPNPATAAICKRLHELSAHATFFIEGKRIRAFPKFIGPMQAFETGIHGEGYNPMIFKRESDIRRSLRSAQILARELQNKGARYFMPPYGFKDLRLIRVANELGLTIINPALTLKIRPALPGQDPSRSISEAVTRLLSKVRPGDIILIPWDRQQSMTEFMPVILTELVHGLKTIGLSSWGLKALIIEN
ncbi:MAG: polysaccharide deacetylase family protein [Dissulfurimicrobium sp.]|uniref:polysaccharide deacetylase family protein n=1 Tax=Dissulfurimicrobium sp. TaxID=2022436 RepID=UPI00404A573F